MCESGRKSLTFQKTHLVGFFTVSLPIVSFISVKSFANSLMLTLALVEADRAEDRFQRPLAY